MGQKFKNIEYIFIGGGSAGDTFKIINNYGGNIDVFILELGKGIYHAVNKGNALAAGDVIGIINAHVFFADQHVS